MKYFVDALVEFPFCAVAFSYVLLSVTVELLGYLA